MYARDTCGRCCGPTAAGQLVHMLGKKLVYPSQNAILFMDYSRSPQQPCRRQRRNTGVAPKPDNHVRTITLHRKQTVQHTNPQYERHDQFCPKTTAGKGRRGNLFNLNLGRKAFGIARSAPIRRQLNPPTFGKHRLGKRLSREHMPTSAAGSQ